MNLVENRVNILQNGKGGGLEFMWLLNLLAVCIVGYKWIGD
jgi:hypothetical protein